MSNEIQLFDFEGQKVRTLSIDEKTYFVGKDVAIILGYQNGSRDINRHVDKEDRQNYQNGTFESPRAIDEYQKQFEVDLMATKKPLPNTIGSD